MHFKQRKIPEFGCTKFLDVIFVSALYYTGNLYRWMIYLPLALHCLDTITFRFRETIVNFITFVEFFCWTSCIFGYCFFVLIATIINRNIKEDTLFYIYLANAICGSLSFFTYAWWMLFKGNKFIENQLDKFEPMISAIANASSFNFVHPVQWEKIEKKRKGIIGDLDRYFNYRGVSNLSLHHNILFYCSFDVCVSKIRTTVRSAAWISIM